MPEPDEAAIVASERAQAVALSRLAARLGVACGGLDTGATIEAFRGWLDAIRADGDADTAHEVEAELVEILGRGPSGSR